MVRRSKSEWFELFEAHEQSGLTAAEFCRQHQLCAKYFSLRKQQLGWPTKPANALLPVVIESEKVRVPDSLRLTLGDIALSIPGDVSPAWVSQLIKALQ